MNEHNIVMNDRKIVTVSGISGVDSYDENCICATTTENVTLVIEGTGLKLSDLDLDKNHLRAEGTINGVFYDEHIGNKKGLFGFGRK